MEENNVTINFTVNSETKNIPVNRIQIMTNQ